MNKIKPLWWLTSFLLLICVTFSTWHVLQNFKISLFCQNGLELQLNLCSATMILRLTQLVKAWCQKKPPHQGCGINPCIDCALKSWIWWSLWISFNSEDWFCDLWTHQDRKLSEAWTVCPWEGKGRWTSFKYCLSAYFVLEKAYKFWFFFCYLFIV